MAEYLLIKEREADIGGGFTVGRILPHRQKRMVGPFCFIDHMGPGTIGPGRTGGIGQHPHIGLSTLTYLLEGAFLHKDSIGTVQTITPGSVNWMTAGRGIVHAEKIPAEFQDGREHPVHGYQIWVALPVADEENEPSFAHLPAADLPAWEENGLRFKLIAGEAYGRRSPVPVYSPLFMIEVTTAAASEFKGDRLFGEIGVCVVDGQIRTASETIERGAMPIWDTAAACAFTVGPEARLLLFGGQAFPEPRFMDWNFVSHDRAKLTAARERWQARQFPMIADETSYVPYPA